MKNTKDYTENEDFSLTNVLESSKSTEVFIAVKSGYYCRIISIIQYGK